MYLYAEYCPLAATTSVIGDYWTPLIVRELLFGTSRFNQLARNLPNISRTLLAKKLQGLERAGVVTCERRGRTDTSYSLTQAGNGLQEIISAMNEWGSRWGTRGPSTAEPDPVLVICMLKDRIHAEALPESRVVLEVTAVGESKDARAWLVCERHAISMCFDPPGFDTDLWVKGSVAALYEVWLQHTSIDRVLKAGQIQVDGERQLVRAFPRWFDSAVAEAMPA